MGDIMKVTYLNHSGFLLELEDCYIIFDYYRGELPPLNTKKEVLVFCSHVHGDHYNPKIFSLLDGQGMSYQAVLSNDILDEKRLSKIKHSFVEADKSYPLDHEIQLETLLSNDSGVAFILKAKVSCRGLKRLVLGGRTGRRQSETPRDLSQGDWENQRQTF